MIMICKKIQIKGTVQGVGFRPFIYKLALKYNIKGWVNNDSKGVNILSYSSEKEFKNFFEAIQTQTPLLAHINSIKIKDIEDKKVYKDFKIIKSKQTQNKSTSISPDMSICQDCIDDINDRTNFRYNYALTNCTNCGPRYSIIKTVPYDRCNTSMDIFELCPKCKKEYESPVNRRYHAQPVSCEKCGPQISLYNKNNELLNTNIQAIKDIAAMINQGEIVAIKGLGGFHLVCDATNENAVKKLRERKNRLNKPFAILFKDLQDVKKYALLSKKEEEIINSKEKPIVLLRKQKNTILCKQIAPKVDKLGCFIAYTPLHYLLFRYIKNPIVATSANLKDEPIIKDKNEILHKLNHVVDFVLDFNRDIINACDDSIVQIINDDICILRNARAYAPNSIKLEQRTKKNILALGANQKSTISLSFEDNLILSPYIGDLNSIESVEYLERTINTFKNFYDFKADTIVCDKHPNYESTKLAFALKQKNQNINIIQIQHHYAHILSTMAEYKLKGDFLSFVFDGTGYGDDRNIWGGEVFIANEKTYKRIKHIKYFKLLGVEKAIKEPKRIALSLLFDIFSLDEILEMDLLLLKQFSSDEIKLFHKMWQKSLNTNLTSSLGRVFDAIAAFADICHIQTYEGETGLKMESYYKEEIKSSYPYKIIENQIELNPMIKEIIKEKDKNIICTKFINTLVKLILEISDKHNFLPIILSGGVFQNPIVLQKTVEELKKRKKEVYYSKTIPLNDGGISVGQAYFAVNN